MSNGQCWLNSVCILVDFWENWPASDGVFRSMRTGPSKKPLAGLEVQTVSETENFRDLHDMDNDGPY